MHTIILNECILGLITISTAYAAVRAATTSSLCCVIKFWRPQQESRIIFRHLTYHLNLRKVVKIFIYFILMLSNLLT